MRQPRASHFAPLALVVCSALISLVACGGDSPAGPSGVASSAQGVVLHGTVVGATAAAGVTLKSTQSVLTGVVTVTVQENPSITTTVAADGSFTLRGLPQGSFTLVFTRDGATLGTLTFGEVKANQEITVTVNVSSGAVVLVEEKRDGIGHGDIEIEGNVDAVLALNPAGESRFQIKGYVVVTRPGDTAIREGSKSRTVQDVTVGRHVHVKGVWLPVEGTTQPVLAQEIMLQGDGSSTPPVAGTCMINGGRAGAGIELEGRVASGSSSNFMLSVNGNRATGPVQVSAGGASFECHPQNGPNAVSPSQCQATVKSGAQVHVEGSLTSCNSSSASVSATKVIVQK